MTYRPGDDDGLALLAELRVRGMDVGVCVVVPGFNWGREGCRHGWWFASRLVKTVRLLPIAALQNSITSIFIRISNFHDEYITSQ